MRTSEDVKTDALTPPIREEIDRMWAEEAERRIQQVKTGEVQPIPGEMTIHEASKFWDTHSVADYPSKVVQFEYKPNEK